MRRLIALLLCALLLCACAPTPASTEPEDVFVIVMPYNARIKNTELNAYVLWLEQQAGVQLRIRMVKHDRLSDYLAQMPTASSLSCDMLWGFTVGDTLLDTNMQLRRYAERGYILPIGNYLRTGGDNMHAMFDSFGDYDLQAAITSSDGALYYVPHVAGRRDHGQVLWLNRGWLDALRLPVPQTTEQLAATLAAFRDSDPNGNGLADELPLCGLTGDAVHNTVDSLLGSFLPFDRQQVFLTRTVDGSVSFAPSTDAFWQGVDYLSRLHDDGLLVPLAVDADNLEQLVCDPRDVIGGFTAYNIGEVIPLDEADILSRYVPVAPLEGPEGIAYTPVQYTVPEPFGLITSNCKNPKRAFELMDLMLSYDASTRAVLGVPGDDWSYEGDALRINNGLWGVAQNSTLTGYCPLYLPEDLWGATLAADESPDREARELYAESRYPHKMGPLLPPSEEAADYLYLQNRLLAFVDSRLYALVTGGPLTDDDKANFHDALRDMDVDRYVALSQRYADQN